MPRRLLPLTGGIGSIVYVSWFVSLLTCSLTFWAKYLENGWRQRLDSNVLPTGNGIWWIKWSCDRWHHMTLKGQVVTPICLGSIISQTVRDRDLVTIYRKWHPGYQMVMCPMTSRDPKRSKMRPRNIWLQISGKMLDIVARFQRTTNRKWHMANQMCT